MAKTKFFNLELSETDHANFKAYAALAGQTMQDYLYKALCARMAQTAKRQTDQQSEQGQEAQDDNQD